VLAPITQDDVWRVSYGELGHLNEEELRERLPAKFEALLPGNPKEGEYQLERFNPFKLQQRCAEKMRVGRIMLAGDAAHLCNPMSVS
jgi:2-polyprenyl-6-methoxyphenol hydroxylase-like FAD-dependent oxidoreductase